MRDKFTIRTDGVCVYVSVRVINPMLGKILLMVADGMVLAVLIFAIMEWIPGLVLVNLILIGLLTRYTLWNIYGVENLIINTKSLSYQHDYGFLKTGYTTKEIKKRLTVQVAQTKQAEEKELLLQFSTYSDNDLPEELYRMALSIADVDAKRLNDMVKQLYVDKLSDEYAMPLINLN